MDSEEDHGPVTKAAAVVAQAELELQYAAREVEKERLKEQAALVGETAFALAKMASPEKRAVNHGNSNLKESKKNMMLSTDQLIRGRDLEPHNGVMSNSPGKTSVAARARLEADIPSRQLNVDSTHNTCHDSHDASDNNAGVSRGKFYPQQVKEMMEAWGKDDTSDGSINEEGSDKSIWNDEYLRPSLSADAYNSTPNRSQKSDERYIKTLEKGRHHLRYTQSTSPDSSPDRHERFQFQHHRASKYSNNNMKRNTRSSDSLKSNSSSSVGVEQTGLLESAKNWLASQREKLHRLELERQVEDQRRKLVEEGRRMRMEEAEIKRRRENYRAAREAARELQQQQSAADIKHNDNRGRSQDELEQHVSCDNNSLAAHTIAGLCGMGGFDDADDDEYTIMGRVNSSGDLVDVECSGRDDFIKVGTPKKTVSGNGMCVKVDLPQEEVHDFHRLDHHELGSQNYQLGQRHARDSFHIDQVKMVDEQTGIPPILSSSQMKSLVLSGALPPSLDYCKWERIYSLSRDGDSFDTFLRNVQGRDRNVLVVKTTLGKIFGGYADTRWEARGVHRQAHEFYGTGQACLFQYIDGDEVKIFKWSGANRYIQLCDSTKRIVAFGGGGDEGVFGLCIEDDFRRGTTGHCETFQNEPLCEEGYFDVVDLEVWGFRLDF